ncbi:Tetratricopeptide repeat-containing protein [Reichenbachiella faecimaris]|uniref:Tetratricopeptide repeat-containing protein n=1 Tax=Reichenbachiella faecimaris TaxID=692418 RepID=A0A1W2G880_REIFA|nr:hypothetical protein [Reichenbachiella faecimaris]SMD32890.1 Tetratricopeptide repeat-containing protein [Reichenbachiella faecimaris]
MKNTIFILIAIYAISCNSSPQTIVNPADYSSYLQVRNTSDLINDLNQEIEFWIQKASQQTNGYTFYDKANSACQQLFELTGDDQYLRQAQDLMIEAAKYAPQKAKVGLLQRLASNAISRHDFQTALVYAEEAVKINVFRDESYLILSDALMEVGQYDSAGSVLKTYEHPESFDFLVRWSKYMDHQGDLDSAIHTMEIASKLASNSGNKKLESWSYSNLGDMYGHAGRIEDSYQYFLSALSINPSDHHALKGIAWIAYANDRAVEQAETILTYLMDIKDSPDYHLLLADMAAFEGNETEKINQLYLFRGRVDHLHARLMYQKHLSVIEAEIFNDPLKAQQLALQEIENRPVPQSYDLLAWSHFHNGKLDKAVKIVSTHVDEKTFEPEILYHMGMIYWSAGQHQKGRKYLKEAFESGYELGPVKAAKIQQMI